jgi:hydrogenase nickel incorporation protein HypA/HybF
MHEFSLAVNIIEIVEESLKANNASVADKLILEIGTLSGVEIPALEMAIESLKPGSVIENAVVKMEIVTAKATCTSCAAVYKPVEFYSPCPYCGSYQRSLTEGKELRVKSIIADRVDENDR